MLKKDSKKFKKMMFLIAWGLLVFSFVSCNLGGPLNGTWKGERGLTYTFKGSNFEYFGLNGHCKGKFNLDNDKKKITMTHTHRSSDGKNWTPHSLTQVFDIEIGDKNIRLREYSRATGKPVGGFVTFNRAKK